MSSLSAYRRANVAKVLDLIEKDYPQKKAPYMRATVLTHEPEIFRRGGFRPVMPEAKGDE